MYIKYEDKAEKYVLYCNTNFGIGILHISKTIEDMQNFINKNFARSKGNIKFINT